VKSFPTCGTCHLAVREYKDLWCYARPPTPERQLIVETEEGAPHRKEVFTSYYPVVGDPLADQGADRLREDRAGLSHPPGHLGDRRGPERPTTLRGR
jgi:hypothetical protein